MIAPVLLVGSVLILSELGVCQPARKQCLQCERVAKPEDCLRRIRCEPEETCFTERYVTSQGHVFYDLGCKLQTTCTASSFDVSKAELEQRAKSKPAGKRQNNGEPMAAHVCEECCDFDHCNDLLCGGHESKLLKCVNCDDMKTMANCEKIRACPGHLMCFVQERITDQFELLYDSGCMREIQCQAYIDIKSQTSGGFFDPCFRCCNETFCNVECTVQLPTTAAPTTVAPSTGAAATAAATTVQPPTPPSTTPRPTPPGPVATTNPPGPTLAPKTTGATGGPTPQASTGSHTPPPLAGRRDLKH